MSGCLDVRAMTPEAALGLLSGADRAVVFEHLEGCERCREAMHEFSALADELMLLAPEAEPPVGFEQRVIDALGAPPRVRRRRGLVVIGAAAAVLLAVVAFAAGRSGQPQPAVREITMRTPSGRVVGDAYVHDDEPAWVFVAAPGWTSTTEMHLRMTFADGSTTEVGGTGSWATVVQGDATAIRELALIDADGSVWCSATVT